MSTDDKPHVCNGVYSCSEPECPWGGNAILTPRNEQMGPPLYEPGKRYRAAGDVKPVEKSVHLVLSPPLGARRFRAHSAMGAGPTEYLEHVVSIFVDAREWLTQAARLAMLLPTGSTISAYAESDRHRGWHAEIVVKDLELAGELLHAVALR